jgi:hypothetical protein
LTQRERVRHGEGLRVVISLAIVVGFFVQPAPFRYYPVLLLPLMAVFAGSVVALIGELPPVGAILRAGSDRLATRGGLAAIGTLGIGTLLCAAVVLLFQRRSGQTFVAQIFMWPAFAAAAVLGASSRRARRVAGIALVLGAVALLAPLGILQVPMAALSVSLVLLSWTVTGWPFALAALLSGVVAYPLWSLSTDPGRRNAPQRQEIQYVLDTTSPDDVVQAGWTMTTLFRRGTSYYVAINPAVHQTVPPEALGREVLRGLETRRPILIENDAWLSTVSGVQDYILEHYEPTGVGPLFRRKDAPLQ